MTMSERVFFAIGLAVATCALGSVPADADRYRVIVERRPFGILEPAAAPGAPARVEPSAPTVSLAKILRLVAITEGGADGLSVGLVSLADKTPKSYRMRVGEERDGIEMVDASFAEEKALVRMDGQEEWIQMIGRSGETGPGSRGSAAAMSGASPAVRRLDLARAGLSLPVLAGSYAERLRVRQEEEERRRKAAEVVNSLGPEVVQAHLAAYQMELVRARGEAGPPLPIPLTPEMDDQLVVEGVLPPQDRRQERLVPQSPVPTPGPEPVAEVQEE